MLLSYHSHSHYHSCEKGKRKKCTLTINTRESPNLENGNGTISQNIMNGINKRKKWIPKSGISSTPMQYFPRIYTQFRQIFMTLSKVKNEIYSSGLTIYLAVAALPYFWKYSFRFKNEMPLRFYYWLQCQL